MKELEALERVKTEDRKENPARKVLIFASYYRPAFKAGGPLKSIENIVAKLSSEFSFEIATRDRDIGDPQAFRAIPLNSWIDLNACRVMYIAQKSDGFVFRMQLIRSTPHDVLYLSSFFAKECVLALLARRLGRGGFSPIVVAPRGEFSSGALALKHVKKSLYMHLGRAIGLFDNLYWHATSALEEGDIKAAFPTILKNQKARILIAPNIPSPPDSGINHKDIRKKRPGEAKIVFFGRIARKKNLDYALKLLKTAPGRVSMDIIGPCEDRGYWTECQALIHRMPSTVEVNYLGEIPPKDVDRTLQRYHLMIFPTRGENFSHAILEALLNGCPVLISDQTPWRGLERAFAGWDIPLQNEFGFSTALGRLIAMDQMEFERWSVGASGYARHFCEDSDLVAASRRLFLTPSRFEQDWSWG